MKVFAQLSLAALASYASATAVNVNKRDSPLSVVLTASGNSEVKVAVTNNGDTALNLLSKGTFLDEVNPVEKVTMYSTGGSKSMTSHIHAASKHFNWTYGNPNGELWRCDYSMQPETWLPMQGQLSFGYIA
jgi:hypothetical protein